MVLGGGGGGKKGTGRKHLARCVRGEARPHGGRDGGGARRCGKNREELEGGREMTVVQML